MKLISQLTAKEKRQIREGVVPVLEKARVLQIVGCKDQEQESFCKSVLSAVERLPEKERLLIEERYLNPNAEDVKDFQVYEFLFEPPISHVTYYTIRDRAMLKLSLALNVDTGVNIYL